LNFLNEFQLSHASHLGDWRTSKGVLELQRWRLKAGLWSSQLGLRAQSWFR
jgi:hypothetical protein